MKLFAVQATSTNRGFYSYNKTVVEGSNVSVTCDKYYRCHRYEGHPSGMGYSSKESKFLYFRATRIDQAKKAWVKISSSVFSWDTLYFIILPSGSAVQVNKKTWNRYRKTSTILPSKGLGEYSTGQ